MTDADAVPPVPPPVPSAVPDPSRGRTGAVLAGAILALAAFNVTRHEWIPGDWQFASNVAMWVAMVGFAALAWMTFDELGLARRELGRGFAYGGAVFGLVVLVVGVAALIPAFAGFFDDNRADIGFGDLSFEVFIGIPIGTVLLEEFAFRGVLLGLLRRVGSNWSAVIVSALLFGVWHLVPALGGGASGLEGEAGSLLGDVGAALGTVFVTTIAGLVFGWLRVRSRSLVAPALAHIATNAVPLVVAWILVRT